MKNVAFVAMPGQRDHRHAQFQRRVRGLMLQRVSCFMSGHTDGSDAPAMIILLRKEKCFLKGIIMIG